MGGFAGRPVFLLFILLPFSDASEVAATELAVAYALAVTAADAAAAELSFGFVAKPVYAGTSDWEWRHV